MFAGRPAWISLLILFFILPASLLAQQSHSMESRLAFLEQKAVEDAAYEQAVSWQNEEDEVDFWTDQRNFERQLELDDRQGYQVYLNSKRTAYENHLARCDKGCDHGDYYQLQSAFYIQYGNAPLQSDTFIATSGSQ